MHMAWFWNIGRRGILSTDNGIVDGLIDLQTIVWRDDGLVR